MSKIGETMMEVSEDSNDINDPAEPQESQNADANHETEVEKPSDQVQQFNSTLDNEIEDDAIDCNEDEELSEKKSKTAGGFTGRGVTLQMLLEDNILQPKEGAMSLEYMGQKFNGDLLPDGKIFSAEVQEVFTSPSAWALRCKKIVNPEQKYGCGWSSVRYFGKPLDVYKNQWMRKRRLGQASSDPSAMEGCTTTNNNGIGQEMDEPEEPDVLLKHIDRQIVKHETLGNRSSIENPHLLVETTAFAAIGKLQPFLVSLSASALVVIDCHCSLVRCEVVGYLGGTWDTNTNTLVIKEAYPFLNQFHDGQSNQTTEIRIAQLMESANLSLVGWYHSHPFAPPTPTVNDIDMQLDNQLKLKGSGDQGYRPCVAMISSPFHPFDGVDVDSTDPAAAAGHLRCYWVSPPAESRPLEVGKPMAMQYTIATDQSNKEDLISKLESCWKYYGNTGDPSNFPITSDERRTMMDRLISILKSSHPHEDNSDLVDTVDTFLQSKIETADQ